MLCKYKNIFGKEAEGVHKYRIFDIAIFDLVGTIFIAFLLAKYFKKNILVFFVLLMILALILHRFFCVNTTINKLVFGNVGESKN